MRIVLCDDDKRSLVQLEGYLREFFAENGLDQPEYAAYTDGGTLLEREGRLEIAFLDVEMPGLTGIQVGAQLQKENPHAKIFIVTSYGDYLDEAMRFHVFRYLSKPLDRERLFRNMRDALYQLSVDTRPVLIETAGETVTRYADEIVMVEAQGRRSLVRALDRDYKALQGIGHWESVLDTGSFYQPHRGFLINMKYVAAFSGNLITLETPGGAVCTAYLARRRCRDFKNAYMLYVEAMR